MAEPILWVNKAIRTQRAKVFNEKTNQVEVAFDDRGRPLYEKIPQSAHVSGDYDNPVVSTTRTWLHLLRHDGNEVRVKLTCAAADLDTSQLTSQERRAKARYFGWIPVGMCPLAMIENGLLREGQLQAKELRGQLACPRNSYSEDRPCPHYLVERRARRLEQAKEAAYIEERNSGETRKVLREQRALNAELITGVSDVMAEALKEFLPTKKK
jgi:hypothetical protein